MGNLNAYVGYSRQYIPLHIVSDGDMQRVSFLQGHLRHVIMVLVITDTLSHYPSGRIKERAVDGVFHRVFLRVDGLLHDERERLKGISIVDSQSKRGMVSAGCLHLCGVKRQHLTPVPSRDSSVVVFVVDDIACACGEQE